MPNTPVIAVDVMGGDHGPAVNIPGAIEAARAYGIRLALVGDSEKIQAELDKLPSGTLSGKVVYDIVHTDEVAGMDEKPSDILRRKKNASIQVACRLVKEGKADGVVSAGNSGATVACGMFIMGRIPGVDRPALASVMPTEKKPIVLLDVGANVDCKPHHLFQFGLMADAFTRDLLDCPSPRIGLLSIGEEEGKGNSQVKEAYDLFKMAKNIRFVGNVEGRDLFTGDVDIIVCDGFVGNVALKLSEGLSSSMSRILKRELLSSLLAKIGTLLAKSAFKRFARMVDYAEYGGAPVLGLKGIAIVCHGASNAKAITNAVKMAAAFVEKKTNERLVEAISANEELTSFGKAVKN
ncbi:phosphate acyltransferase PlsX [Desulfovibrio psychrotolerans]|uniref:Phosphate acyltransferase n=1 Tax=Desulfovibrio psychrotolerans TaxID=415242 RepID=A0A7J0BUK9_9BACT|nr:phosphate acyltransferase PlsX [Desulfovibrio psychrotolerans]GFM37397.1 phosphate acyltransferase [Desulfovibrio psychrotolerans]